MTARPLGFACPLLPLGFACPLLPLGFACSWAEGPAMNVQYGQAMQRWEYFTTTLEANVEIAAIPVRDDIPQKEHGRHSPYTLIPQLNSFGDRGWELVSIEPVAVGKHEDVVRPDATAGRWGRSYFCCFKRQIND